MLIHKNYTLAGSRNLPHIGVEGYLYSHTSGARVLYLKSEDDNKVFSATFKTPPTDETGIAHIMEHCVLNGSQKYPLKDPFNELSKGSLCTFLNAMTYPDRTMYPVASVNDKDFMILMDVYLDAVFFPKVYDRKETLLQEGWHYQLENAADPLKYNGIVYNEMKGAYSDPQELMGDALKRLLFPESIYSLDSGGNPEHIPDLTYAQFLAFHKKYYHPENAFIYLYGNMDVKACFAKMDAEYLSKFAPSGEAEITVAAQKPLAQPAFAVESYSVADEGDLNENFIGMAAALPSNMPPRDLSGLQLLNYVLMSTPASPLYKAIVEAGIGEDISGYTTIHCLHPQIYVTMRNASVDLEGFKARIDGFLREIADGGIPKDFVAACLNHVEFIAKEEDYGAWWSKGLAYNDRALIPWLYGHSPFDGLRGLEYLAEIRTLCETGGYLEGLIRSHLLDNPHRAFVQMRPVHGLDGQKDAAVADKLAALKADMSDAQIAEIMADYQAFKTYQQTPDTPEILGLIPRVAVADIKKEIERVPLNILVEKDAEILHAPLPTNDIVYVTMLFDMQGVPADKLPLVRVLQHVLSKVATKKYDTAGLTQEIKANLGGLSFAADCISKTQQDFAPRAVVSGKFLSKNAPAMFDLTHEILTNTVFNDRSQIKNYVLELKASMEDMFLTSGSGFAAERSAAYFSPWAAYNDAMAGLGFYEFLKQLAENFDNHGVFEGLQADLTQLLNTIYTKSGARYGIVGTDELYAGCMQYLHTFHDGLSAAAVGTKPAIPLITPKNEGFITASKVQYCALSADFHADGFAYSGGMKVLSNVLDDYLYEEIRVKGGAYGLGSSFSQNGGMCFYSYRDPHVVNTYKVYSRAADYVRNLSLSTTEMEKFIIGTIRGYDRPATNAHKGLRAMTNHMLDITDEMRQKERDEILGATINDVKKLADMIEAAVAQNNVCAVGGEAAINEGKELFGTVKRI